MGITKCLVEGVLVLLLSGGLQVRTCRLLFFAKMQYNVDAF